MSIAAIGEGLKAVWEHRITKGVIVVVALATIAALVIGSRWWAGLSGPFEFASVSIGMKVCGAAVLSSAFLLATGMYYLGKLSGASDTDNFRRN